MSTTNTNPAATYQVPDPDAPATRPQRQLIGRAVKQNLYPRFSKEDWTALTKGQAFAIINELPMSLILSQFVVIES